MTDIKNTEFNEIEDMIKREPDEKDRTVLLILNRLTAAIVKMDETGNQHGRRIADSEARLDIHNDIVIQSKTAWKVLTVIFLGISGFFISAITYGYNKIAEMDTELTKISVVLPKVETIFTANEVQAKNIDEAKADIEGQIGKLETMKKDLTEIKSKKVIRAAK